MVYHVPLEMEHIELPRFFSCFGTGFSHLFHLLISFICFFLYLRIFKSTYELKRAFIIISNLFYFMKFPILQADPTEIKVARWTLHMVTAIIFLNPSFTLFVWTELWIGHDISYRLKFRSLSWSLSFLPIFALNLGLPLKSFFTTDWFVGFLLTV
jgi:hypothetical protein